MTKRKKRPVENRGIRAMQKRFGKKRGKGAAVMAMNHSFYPGPPSPNPQPAPGPAPAPNAGP